jgi:C_GCAxxG_C_C family probable redox protein
MTRTEKALSYRQRGFSCSQAVFAAFAPEYGISEDSGLKIACAFGAGMGRQQFTCGAVSGALMVLGLKYGMGLNDPSENKNLTYSKTTEFFHKFREKHRSLNCRELLDGLDMNDPEDYRMILEKGLFVSRCNKYVEDAVKILEKMMK